MDYRVVYTKSAVKDLARITRGNPVLGKQLLAAADALSQAPRPNGCKKLKGEDAYRIRVREYRIVYTVSDQAVTVEVFRFASRASAYE